MISSNSTAFFFFFFNDTATTEIYTLSLHDALPICLRRQTPDLHAGCAGCSLQQPDKLVGLFFFRHDGFQRSEEHTSELQSRLHLVCRLLLEKKKILL